MKRLGFAEGSDPLIDISDRPLDEQRPVGPLVGCGEEHEDKLGGTGGTFAFTVDVDTVDLSGAERPTPGHVKFDVVNPVLPSQLGQDDIETSEQRTGDVRVGIDISDVGMGVVEDLRGMINQIEGNGVEVYDVRIE